MERLNRSQGNREPAMLWRPFTIVIVIIAGLILSLIFINSRYQTQTLKQQYHAQIETDKLRQQKLEALHELDIQHTEELSNAKVEIDKLDNTVHPGNKRLRVNAVCKTQQTATTESRHDETTL